MKMEARFEELVNKKISNLSAIWSAAPTMLNIQNVFDYQKTYDKEKKWSFEDYPNIAPPWPLLAMIYERPSRMLFKNGAVENPPGEGSVLVIGWSFIFPEHSVIGPKWMLTLQAWFVGRLQSAVAQFTVFVGTSGDTTPLALLSIEQKEFACEALHLPGALFDRAAASPDNVVLTCHCPLDDNLEPDASIIERRRKILSAEEYAKFIDVLTSFGDVLLPPAYLALSFCHCRNVKTSEVQLDRAARRRARRGEIPSNTWRSIMIDPVKSALEPVRADAGGSLKKALHICRGHFATYSGAGLFGRDDLKGSFFRPMHIRGSAQHGVAHRDYTIKAPA